MHILREREGEIWAEFLFFFILSFEMTLPRALFIWKLDVYSFMRRAT
jgi:hypothetical protein